MKVGTDGVLLGAWATVPGPGSRVLDVGTGTGLIALMIAQRTKEVKLDALEIDPSSARQAQENFQNSPWKERITCIHTSFQEYSSWCKSHYELIICNPPFFSASSLTPSKEKNLARHDDSLSLGDLFQCSRVLMTNKSIFNLILPVQKEVQANDLAGEHRMHCRRKTRVMPAPGKPGHRVLLEYSFLPGVCEEDTMAIETGKRHCYSRKYLSLTDEFYLGEGDG
jgi:tRNA1Val (adenine37-N6)-methyltransferase